MKSNIIMKHLSIGVSSSDESYMPELITISVGSTPAKLREIKEIKVEKCDPFLSYLLKGLWLAFNSNSAR